MWQALKEAAGVDLDEDDEEEAETPTTDDLLKTALAAFLGQQAKTKKTRAPGLPLAGVAEDSEEEEADPLRTQGLCCSHGIPGGAAPRRACCGAGWNASAAR